MKKFFAAALVVSMLTVLLSGCMCQVADTTFQFDGSGTVEAKFGFSEEMVNAMNMRAEMTQNGFSYFRYNGHSYYGDQASESFANADEFNAIFAEVSAEISEVSKAATPGKVTLSVADDGGLDADGAERSRMTAAPRSKRRLPPSCPTIPTRRSTRCSRTW